MKIPKPYEWHFEYQPKKPKRYLLRLINTSFGSAFVFSIDNHRLQVVAADFVPIEPYNTTSLLILIGQRYDVIVEANPINSTFTKPEDMNFWVRTQLALNCSRVDIPSTPGYERAGVLRYSASEVKPASDPWPNIPQSCLDKRYLDTYKPKLNWQLNPKPANGEFGERFEVRLNLSSVNTSQPYQLAKFSLEKPGTPVFTPLRISYENPTFFHLDDASNSYPQNWVVVPEDVPNDEWVS